MQLDERGGGRLGTLGDALVGLLDGPWQEGGIPDATKQELEALGHLVTLRGRQGVTHCIMIDPVTAERIGAADPRDVDGAAVGY